MATYGSNPSLSSQAIAGLVDELGNSLVSTSTSFGASPTGISIRTEALFGIANATFDLLPPDPEVKIGASNPLPFWDIEDLSSGSVTATSTFDETTGTWAVLIDPTTAGSADAFTLKTRSFFVTDDNLALRQQAYLTLEKVGTYSSTSQWAAVLSAEYFDHVGASLGTYAIGTVADNTTWTGISGFTTSGGSAISSSASYVDLSFTLTTTAAVTSSVEIKVKSALLYSSTGGGASSFIVTERFDASTTWTVPTGVDYLLAVIAVGGGKGGNGGNVAINNSFTLNAAGGSAGNSGGYAFLRDLALGTVTSVSVGIGAGGAGGTARTQTKPNPDSAVYNLTGGTGANGGATTFGSFLTASGGSASAGSATSPVWPQPTVVVTNNFFTTNGYTSIPYQDTFPSAGQNGSAGTTSAGDSIASGAGGSATANMVKGVGGAGGQGQPGATSVADAGGTAISGGGGGGGAAAVRFNSTGTYTATGGAGGSASANSGSGGGGGGGAAVARASSGTSYTQSVVTATSGSAGNGGSGYVIIAFVA